ncbi:hypothetical protein TUMSATVNIG1_13890 [Vibrio nigripulchritudo]|uniref:hypothetical protein n=1 Tax=Vibrio nigripulchritudo TaxID=28173 RepID=UPI00190B9118|nr:hypothetical protein [Vibrio nigripulchritudo]BCL69440.1 hypothetical protein VNTUMSATTG_13770 [Vibrio nigripulchritudo]BDU30780.1 hypothetical protein TUMSATVNIG1_13890 [Vibrio nigripulchritudo]
MKIGIMDDDCTYKVSALLLEEALRQGADNFSVQLNLSVDASKDNKQIQFLNKISSFYLGDFSREIFFFSHNTYRYFETSRHYTFSRSTIPIISEAMGRGLMDCKADLEWGMGEWQFYSNEKLISGADIKGDCFIVNNSSSILLKRLEELNVTVIPQT